MMVAASATAMTQEFHLKKLPLHSSDKIEYVEMVIS